MGNGNVITLEEKASEPPDDVLTSIPSSPSSPHPLSGRKVTNALLEKGKHNESNFDEDESQKGIAIKSGDYCIPLTQTIYW